MGHGGARAPSPTFTNDVAHEGTVSRRTANKKLTKLYWPSRKRSPKRLIVLLEPKSGGHDQKNFPALRARSVPPLSLRTGAPHFQIRSGATGGMRVL